MMATTGTEDRMVGLLEGFRDCERLYDTTNSYGQMNYGEVGFLRARKLIPDLLAQIERLTAENTALRARLEGATE